MKQIFVFGSNECGRHGAGAARYAYENYGARMGQGFGPQGLAFAIPTKDWQIMPLDYGTIRAYVDRFIVYARINEGDLFKVTALGTGLAGLRGNVIAPMFKYAPENCRFDTVWREHLPYKEFWGTW